MITRIVFTILLASPFLCQGQKDSSGSFGLTISLPWTNNYVFYDHYSSQDTSTSGFMGIGGAFFYKHGNKKLSLNFGITSDLPAPIGPIDFAKEGTRKSIEAFLLDLIYHQTVHRRLAILGGVNFVDYRFKLTSYVDTIPTFTKDDKTIGITIGPEYLSKKSFSLALMYRPALVSFSRKQYRHILSLDVRFNFIIGKKRK